MLPVGFTEDVNTFGVKFVGFNGSACHTSKLRSNGAEIIVHGGQSMADFQAFTTDLIQSVETIATDKAAFDEFAQRMAGSAANGDKNAALRKELEAWLDLRKTINDTANSSHWGRGRADAVGIILATTAMVVADPSIAMAEREPLPASNAPVSYPFVWNANQQARLQYNGVVDNGVDFGVLKVAKIGALIRN